MDDLHVQIARIDENVKFLKETLEPLPEKISSLELEQALAKRNVAWFMGICSIVASTLTVAWDALWQWFKR